MLSVAQPTCFLIADISGYTGYLADVELDHAQDILADLVGAVVTALRPGFRLAKLEGDAAFTFMTAEKVDGSMLLDTIERCYFGFRRRRRDVRQATSCDCAACARIPDLDLKFVVHHGVAIVHKVAGRQELVGSDVIVVHRLLKNEVVEKLGIHAYALISQQCIDASDLDPAALGMREHTETYDRIGDVRLWAHDLERRWQEEEARGRVWVSPEESILIVSVPTSVPPQVAWEFVTKPGQRMTWQPWVTEVTVKGTTGGRRGPGSANHCMHGKDAVVEEILDWRPYDYVTDRTVLETPGGPVKLLHTVEFEPGTTGTTIHFRYAAPKTRREKELMKVIAPAYGQALRSGIPSLIAQLDAELAARDADRGPEPELIRPRPGGPLSGLGPLVIVG
jgi:class 3 adenylate cyclase